MRAGGFLLSLLSVPLNVHVLQTLDEEPRPLTDLRRAVGSPPQTTMRGHLRSLTEIGVLERRRNSFPGSVDYRIGKAGEDLLEVRRALQDWLAVAPDGPVGLGSVAAKSAIKALVQGWSSAIVRALAARPLSLTELNRLIAGLNYPSLERRLGAMRLVGQIEARSGQGRSTPYAVTEWLRLAVAPLLAACAWERQHLPTQTPALGKLDIESIFLLTIPMLTVPSEHSGRCRFAAELRAGGEGGALAGTMIEVADGRIASCASRLEGTADAWATGSSSAWIEAIRGGEFDRLELGGDCQLALALLDALNGTLFGAPQRT